jgi:hypothetical protein
MGASVKPGQNLGAVLSICAIIIGACSACTAASGAPTELPEFDSLHTAFEAVDKNVGCVDGVNGATSVYDNVDKLNTESTKCTDTVEVFYCETAKDREHVVTTLSVAAEGDGSMQFVEGKNWFVVDYSEVAVGSSPDGSRDLAGLAEKLEAEFTEVG